MRILYLPNSYSQQRQKEKPANIYPVRLAMEAEWYYQQGNDVWWGERNCGYKVLWNKQRSRGWGVWDKSDWDKIIEEPENLPFLTLPRPDRVFTEAKEYDSGNYKYKPGTHILSASGCWHGKCSFCVENGQPYEVRPVEDVISEIEECKALGFKEVFDDSATFPTGKWLEEFLIKYDGSIPIGCNMRVSNQDWSSLVRRNFRMVLFGLESTNQITLDKINKGVKVEDIIPTIKKAAKAGLEPHIAVMFGFPWETDAEALNTIRMVHYLLRKGYAKTAQASFYCPEEGTQAYQEGQKGQESHRHYVNAIYNVWKFPDFWYHQLRDITNVQDLKYFWRKINNGVSNYLH